MNNTSEENTLSSEDYAQAMNLIGQAMYSSLAQTMENLAPALRNNEMVIQGLAAFFSNIIHQQASEDEGLRQHMLNHFTSVVKAHLDHFSAQTAAVN